MAVKVLNGNGSEGSATVAANSLTLAGFKVASTGNALSHSYTATVVQYAPGQQAKAAFLRSNLTAGAEVEEDKSLVGADVALVLGLDYTGLRTATSAAPPSSTAVGGTAAPDTTKVPPSC